MAGASQLAYRHDSRRCLFPDLFVIFSQSQNGAPVHTVSESATGTDYGRGYNAACGGVHRTAFPTALTVVLLCLVSVGLLVAIAPDAFADFLSYQYIVEELRSPDWSDLLTFEPLSRLFLYFCSTLTNDSADVVSFAHYVNALIYICAIIPIAIRYAAGWRNVILFGALYSPLLAFVTLRATPAYFLVAIAYFIRDRHPGKALAASIVAVGFHVSAALAVFPLILTANNRLGRAFVSPNTRWTDISIVFAAVLIYIFLGGLSAYLPQVAAFLEGQGAFAKFAVYAALAGDMQSTMHRVYFVMTLGVVVLLLISRGDFNRRDVRYMTLSFLTYAALTISPVVAFRESIYWMMPLVLIMPLHRYMQTAALSFVFCVACGVLYAMAFYGVLS
jgi:hypothetical protein